MPLKYNCEPPRLSKNPSSKRMQIFSNSGSFLSAFGVAWRFSPENAASIRPAIRDATVIVSVAATRSCGWPVDRVRRTMFSMQKRARSSSKPIGSNDPPYPPPPT